VRRSAAVHTDRRAWAIPSGGSGGRRSACENRRISQSGTSLAELESKSGMSTPNATASVPSLSGRSHSSSVGIWRDAHHRRGRLGRTERSRRGKARVVGGCRVSASIFDRHGGLVWARVARKPDDRALAFVSSGLHHRDQRVAFTRQGPNSGGRGRPEYLRQCVVDESEATEDGADDLWQLHRIIRGSAQGSKNRRMKKMQKEGKFGMSDCPGISVNDIERASRRHRFR